VVDEYKLRDVDGFALEELDDVDVTIAPVWDVAFVSIVVVFDGESETHAGGAGPVFTVPMTRRFEIENFELASMSLVPAGQSSFPGTQPELNHWDDTSTAPSRSMVSTTTASDSFDGRGWY
jgi:hypothetical protein